MTDTKTKRSRASENRYAQLDAALGKSVFPQTVEIVNEDFLPERFYVPGIQRVELFAAVALASLAHALATRHPVGGGTLRSGWTRRVALDAARLARTLDEALDAPAGESPEEGESATHKTRRP